MKGALARFEWLAYVAILAVLSGLLWSEARANAALQEQLPLTAKSLYRTLMKSKAAVQVLDVRGDLSEGYEDTHIPGAIPFPDCDLDKAPASARSRILPYVPTVIVSGDGERAAFDKCRAKFALARNLQGGLDAWVEAGYPEDSGEYSPPKSGGGGGCL